MTEMRGFMRILAPVEKRLGYADERERERRGDTEIW